MTTEELGLAVNRKVFRQDECVDLPMDACQIATKIKKFRKSVVIWKMKQGHVTLWFWVNERLENVELSMKTSRMSMKRLDMA